MRIKTSFQRFVNESKINQKYVTDFLNDFGFLISLNFSQITKMGIDPDSTDELKQMMTNIRKPIINGSNFFELTKDVNKLYENPKLISALLNKVREFLIYIEPRIVKFVIDNEYKSSWLKKIEDLKIRYKKIVD
jgi:hypothetical protein